MPFQRVRLTETPFEWVSGDGYKSVVIGRPGAAVQFVSIGWAATGITGIASLLVVDIADDPGFGYGNTAWRPFSDAGVVSGGSGFYVASSKACCRLDGAGAVAIRFSGTGTGSVSALLRAWEIG